MNQDLSAKVHGLPLSPAAGIRAFPVTTTQLEAYCVTNDLEVHQFTLANGAWTDQDLNNNQLDGSINQMVAFKTPNNHFHIFYPPNDMYQLSFNGTSWSDDDLTTLSGGGIHNATGEHGWIHYQRLAVCVLCSSVTLAACVRPGAAQGKTLRGSPAKFGARLGFWR